MKSLFAAFTVLACVTVTSAQTNVAVEALRKIYSEHVSWQEAGELAFDADTKVLAVKNYRIPVSVNTHLAEEKNTVRFMMQNYTAVTDVNNPSWRRAEFIIPFKNSKSAKEFAKHFNTLINKS